MKRKYILVPVLSGAVLMAAYDSNSTRQHSQYNNVTSSEVANTNSSKESPQLPVDHSSFPIIPSLPCSPSFNGSANIGSVVKATPEQRAKKLGFAKHLPKNLVSFSGIYNGRKAFDKLMKTGLGDFILKRLADEDMSLEDIMADDEVAKQISTYGEECFAAYGPGFGDTANLAVQLYEKIFYYSSKTGIYVGDHLIKDGEDFDPEFGEFLNGPLKGAPKDIIAILAAFDMPSVYQGSKVSDKEARKSLKDGALDKMAVVQDMFDDAAKKITVKRGGTTFEGYEISGKVLSEKIDEDTIKAMQNFIDIDDIKSFKNTLAKKSLVLLVGEMDGYVITFVGKSAKDLVFADKVEDSICANEKLAPLDAYLGKDILVAAYSDASAMNKIVGFEPIAHRLVASLANGIKDGLANAESLGDNQDVVVLLESLEEQGKALSKMFTVQDAVSLVYLEDGVKAEVFGGGNVPSLDFNTTHHFGALENGKNQFIFANWVSNKEYNQKVYDYLDTLGETSYLVAKRIASLNIPGDDLEDFKSSLEMFDKKFSKDMLNIWSALRDDLSSGLGAESAVVVDMNGAMPKVPDALPQELLKEGKMPRFAYVSAVDDRKKLQASWKKIEGSTENLLKTYNSLTGNNIPMQDMMSSEKNGLTTWWTSIPFTGNDFMPCISVSDSLFMVSTSKMYSESLAAQLKGAGSDAGRKGAWLKVDFKVLNGYTKQWLDLVDKHADKIFKNENMKKDYEENKPMIKEALKAFETLDELTVHARVEGGVQRISGHLKAK